MTATLPRPTGSARRTHPGLGVAVRAHTAVHGGRLRAEDALSRRTRRLRDDGESGAQAAEYAMVGAVGACICALIIELLRGGGLVNRIVEALVDVVVRVIQSFFA